MRRRSIRMMQNRQAVQRQPVRPVPPEVSSGKSYIPDVRPFMRGAGYTEGLEEILAEIDRFQKGGNFYYEQGDLWRKKP